MVDCGEPIMGSVARTENSSIGILSGLQVDGQFQTTDTIFLDENNSTCDFKLQFRDIGDATNCGGVRQRIFELLDLCDPQESILLVDTQFIEIIDTICLLYTSPSPRDRG